MDLIHAMPPTGAGLTDWRVSLSLVVINVNQNGTAQTAPRLFLSFAHFF